MLQLHSQTDGANVLSPRRVAGVSACGALFAPVPGRSGYGAHTAAALASPAAAAKGAVLRGARLGAGAAVAVVPTPAALATTLAAVARSVAYGNKATKMSAQDAGESFTRVMAPLSPPQSSPRKRTHE